MCNYVEWLQIIICIEWLQVHTDNLCFITRNPIVFCRGCLKIFLSFIILKHVFVVYIKQKDWDAYQRIITREVFFIVYISSCMVMHVRYYRFVCWYPHAEKYWSSQGPYSFFSNTMIPWFWLLSHEWPIYECHFMWCLEIPLRKLTYHTAKRFWIIAFSIYIIISSFLTSRFVGWHTLF